jgi:hypothetical protein
VIILVIGQTRTDPQDSLFGTSYGVAVDLVIRELLQGISVDSEPQRFNAS